MAVPSVCVWSASSRFSRVWPLNPSDGTSTAYSVKTYRCGPCPRGGHGPPYPARPKLFLSDLPPVFEGSFVVREGMWLAAIGVAVGLA
jgi:hypothetical protein